MNIDIIDITLSFVKAASLISQSRFRLILILNANVFPKKRNTLTKENRMFLSYTLNYIEKTIQIFIHTKLSISIEYLIYSFMIWQTYVPSNYLWSKILNHNEVSLRRDDEFRTVLV